MAVLERASWSFFFSLSYRDAERPLVGLRQLFSAIPAPLRETLLGCGLKTLRLTASLLAHSN